MPKGLTVITNGVSPAKNIVTIGGVQFRLGKVSMRNLPKTTYDDKKDLERIKYFKEEILQGHDIEFAKIHERDDGTIDVMDGKHKIEAYRQLGFKEIPVVFNAISPQAVELLQKGIRDPYVGMGGIQTQVLRADVKGEV